MYTSISIAEKIKQLSDKNNTSTNQLLVNCSVNKNAIVNMLNGSMPRCDIVAKIADYFNCSVDYLLGRVDNPTYLEASKNENSIKNSGNDLTVQEAELIEIYRSLDLEGQRKVLAALFEVNNRF